MSDLKPCPFHKDERGLFDPRKLNMQETAPPYYVECVCGVLGPDGDTPEKSIKAWNTREGD
jgi:hypothetical protein